MALPWRLPNSSLLDLLLVVSAMLATTVPEASTSAHLALAEGLSSPKSWIVTRLHESWTASQAELIHATHPALLATNRAMVRLAILELNYRTETIFALIESPSDKHQRHARRYSTNVSRIYISIIVIIHNSSNFECTTIITM